MLDTLPVAIVPHRSWKIYDGDLPSDVQVESERTELLAHPLVTSLLDQKWRSHGRIVFYSNLALYIVFLIFLTVFALVLPNPQAAVCMSQNPPSTFNTTNNPVVMIMANNVSSLSATLQSFLNSSDISVMDNRATLSGQLVCSNTTVRDELAMAMSPLINESSSDTFFNGAAQCGDCSKLCPLVRPS